jgi:hypothetical protein
LEESPTLHPLADTSLSIFNIIPHFDIKSCGRTTWQDYPPKDIVICDWHYNEARGTISLFATNGFDVVACPWRKADVALAQLKEIRELRQGGRCCEARAGHDADDLGWVRSLSASL